MRFLTILLAATVMIAIAAIGGGSAIVAPAVHMADTPAPPPDPPPCWPFTCPSESEQMTSAQFELAAPTFGTTADRADAFAISRRNVA
jgi:hypothetical protein